MSSHNEPMLVSLMRLNPTGEVRYIADLGKRGMIGTSTAGFLTELDEWLSDVERKAAAETLEALQARITELEGEKAKAEAVIVEAKAEALDEAVSMFESREFNGFQYVARTKNQVQHAIRSRAKFYREGVGQ